MQECSQQVYHALNVCFCMLQLPELLARRLYMHFYAAGLLATAKHAPG